MLLENFVLYMLGIISGYAIKKYMSEAAQRDERETYVAITEKGRLTLRRLQEEEKAQNENDH